MRIRWRIKAAKIAEGAFSGILLFLAAASLTGLATPTAAEPSAQAVQSATEVWAALTAMGSLFSAALTFFVYRLIHQFDEKFKDISHDLEEATKERARLFTRCSVLESILELRKEHRD